MSSNDMNLMLLSVGCIKTSLFLVRVPAAQPARMISWA